jgi:aminopeptidase N
MTWFNDVWMKEVFASFMAAKVVNPLFPEQNHELQFLFDHYPEAYEIDRSAGTNAVRQELANLNDSASLYGAIIYNKAPVVMRQLELMIGPETFQEGVREYLRKYSFENASWPDLIEILDRKVTEDLKGWSQRWIEDIGRPTIRVETQKTARQNQSLLLLSQQDPFGKDRRWTQDLKLLVSDRGATRFFPVRLQDAVHELVIDPGFSGDGFILPNGKGIGYGLFQLDDNSLRYLVDHLPEVDDELARAVAWVTLWDALLEEQVTAQQFLDLALAALPEEEVEVTVQRVLGYLSTAYWRFLTAEERAETAPHIEALLWKQIEQSSSTTLKASYFRAWRDLFLSEEGSERTRQVWAGELKLPDLPLEERDFTALALALAVRQVPGSEEILEEQLERIEAPDRKARLEFLLPAVSRDPQTRLSWFESLASPENRSREPWVLDGLKCTNHPLRAGDSVVTIRPALELMEEIKQTGSIFFPKNWLDAVLSGHSSQEAAGIVRQFLAEHPDYPPRLRGKILQSAELLYRAAAR